MNARKAKANPYVRLMRLNKPIGIYLVLWPTLWALWLASEGIPSWDVLVIFIVGVVLMRSAGCVINDFADRKVDGQVKRTLDRPLVTGEVSDKQALILFCGLVILAFVAVLLTNKLTILLSFGALALAACYPFMKRFTHLPQVVLGAAFAWSIPMAFAAVLNAVPTSVWLVYTVVVVWTVAYDTFYAMVDRDDDLKVGVKSTAILFGEQDRVITGALQFTVIFALGMVGQRFQLGVIYNAGVLIAALLFVYQQWLIARRQRERCFKAFLNNNWVGLVVFLGIALDYALGTHLGQA
jgi:4-hydroxybenzoate polyprenyltransferase